MIAYSPASAFSNKYIEFFLTDVFRKVKSDQSEHVKREFRLRKSSDFMQVRRLGKSYAHPLMVLIVLRNQRESSRFAIAAGRSVGKAVQRNRAKRLLRESIHPLIPLIDTGWDILILARQPLSEVSSHQSQAALITLLKKANLLISDTTNHDD